MSTIKPITTPIAGATGATPPAAGTTPATPAAPIDGIDPVVDTTAIDGPSTASLRSMDRILESFPVNALEKLDAKGVQGQSFMLDGGSLRGLKMMVRRVRDGDDSGFEIVFKLTDSKLGPVLKSLEKHEAKKQGVTFRGADVDDDGICRYNDQSSVITKGGSHVPTDTDSSHLQWALQYAGTKGGSLEVVHDKAAHALRGFVRIQLRGDDKECTKQLQGMIKSFGIGQIFAPPTPKSKRNNLLMRALWQADNKKAKELGSGDIDKLKTADIKKALVAAGFSEERIKGLRYEEVFDGHFTVIDPVQAQEMAEAGARYMYSTVTSPEHAHLMLTGGQKASLQRFHEGLIVTGMSTNSDFSSGGAVGVFTRVVTQNSIYNGSGWTGRTYKLVQSHEQLGRTDWYGWNGDFFGRRWDLDSEANFGPSLIKAIDGGGTGAYKSNNELIFTAGNTPLNIERVVATSEPDRQKLIDLLKKKDFKAPNGLALDDFVVLSPKFLVFGPSPYKCDDPAAFVKDAKAKAKAGDTAPLQWFLTEGPTDGGEKGKLQAAILKGADTANQTLLYKAIKLQGEFAMTPKQLDALLKKLSESEESGPKNVLNQLVSQCGEAMFRSDNTLAANLMNKSGSASSYNPFGLDDTAWVRIYRDLASKQKDGAKRSEAFQSALDVRADKLLQSNHAGFLDFLKTYPLVTPAKPQQWVGKQIATMKDKNTASADLTMFAAQLSEPEDKGALQAQLIKADHSQTLTLLKKLVDPTKSLDIEPAALRKLLEALPEDSATRKYIVTQLPEALLKTGDVGFLKLLDAQFPSDRTFGMYGSRWKDVAGDLLDKSEGKLTPMIRECLERGGEYLAGEKDFRARLAKMDDLYAPEDVAKFTEDALGQLAKGQSGVIRLTWLFTGPGTEASRSDVALAIIRSGNNTAKQVLERARSDDPNGHLPLTAKQLNDMVKALDNDETPAGLEYLLKNAGRQVLAGALKGLLPILSKHVNESGNALQKFGLTGQQVTATLTDLATRTDVGAKGVAAWVVEHTAAEMLKGTDAAFVAQLTSQKLQLADIGHDATWAAAKIGEMLKASSHQLTTYTTDAWAKMPIGTMWLLRPDGVEYDEAVLEAVEAALPEWSWQEKLFDAFIERAVDLPDAWKQRLKKAHEKAPVG